MNDNKIELSGIFSQGYGVIPKKLMKMQFDNISDADARNIKLILAYMLSFTGAGDTCFPTIKTISKDLNMGQTTIVETIRKAVELNLIDKQKMFPDNPLKRNNKYTLKFMKVQDVDVEVSESEIRTTDNCNFKVQIMKPNNNSINNNSINIKNADYDDVILGIYNSYPNRCYETNRRTGKCKANKDKIKRMLLHKPPLELSEDIRLYIDDCKRNKTPMMNLATFLNNIPDRESYMIVNKPPDKIEYKETKHKPMEL